MLSETLAPTILNTTMTLADNEYEVAIPTDTRYFTLYCLTAFEIRFAWVTGKVATPTAPYAVVPANSAYSSPEKLATSLTPLYVACADAGKVACVVAWTHRK